MSLPSLERCVAPLGWREAYLHHRVFSWVQSLRFLLLIIYPVFPSYHVKILHEVAPKTVLHMRDELLNTRIRHVRAELCIIVYPSPRPFITSAPGPVARYISAAPEGNCASSGAAPLGRCGGRGPAKWAAHPSGRLM